ncbi:hypothetical protein PoB_005419200 [Plakobranchus ocellatus]|uniref:Uncharacterized protein n=1 Tax=Plakobranchus ocellatus TaxID=259542 RepID=A0AAV4C840_9GAST|nr:hypothetical protein PoB_005419200 [Plakobranchus ocellatus]
MEYGGLNHVILLAPALFLRMHTLLLSGVSWLDSILQTMTIAQDFCLPGSKATVDFRCIHQEVHVESPLQLLLQFSNQRLHFQRPLKQLPLLRFQQKTPDHLFQISVPETDSELEVFHKFVFELGNFAVLVVKVWIITSHVRGMSEKKQEKGHNSKTKRITPFASRYCSTLDR